MHREQHGAEQQLAMLQKQMQDAQVVVQQTQANLANTTNAATECVQKLAEAVGGNTKEGVTTKATLRGNGATFTKTVV